MRTFLLASTLLTLAAVFPSSSNAVAPVVVHGATAVCPDFNGDGVVTLLDIFVMASRIGESEGSADWSSEYDLDGDGRISEWDAFFAAAQFGSECRISGSSVPFETITQGVWSGAGSYSPELSTARDIGEWEDLWAEHASVFIPAPQLPSVDFESEMVVGVFAAAATGRYSLTITRIHRDDEQWTVEATFLAPGPGCLVPGSMTHPHHIVRTQRTDLPVNLSLRRFVYSCPY